LAQNTKETILEIVSPVIDEMGLIFVDSEFVKMGNKRLLRIFVDKTGGIDMNACEAFHRRIADPIDVIDFDYLEVSSPGDRPLKTDADYRRMLGRDVDVHLYVQDDAGQRDYTGTLEASDKDTFTLNIGGQVKTFDKKSAATVRPHFEMI
jgi:ribosome maturation factor RimP